MDRKQLFNEFRVAQLALKSSGDNQNLLILGNIDQIPLPNSYLYLCEVYLNRDLVRLNFGVNEIDMPLTALSDSVIDMIVTTMKRKALELADKLTSKEDI